MTELGSITGLLSLAAWGAFVATLLIPSDTTLGSWLDR